MNILETISSAISSIRSNKMRSAFTMFGIIVGIASVMMITSVGDGFRNTMTGFFEDMGLDEIQIFNTNNVRPVEWHERLNFSDADFLRSHPSVLAASARLQTTIPSAVTVLGTTDMRAIQLLGRDQYDQIFSGPDLIYGRHIGYSDILAAAPVVIIDESFSNSVFGTSYSIGRTLEVRTNQGTRNLEVIGVLESNDMFEMMDIFEMPFEARVPITYVQNLVNWGNEVGSIFVRVHDTDLIHHTGEQIINLLEIRKDAPDVFNAFSMASALTEVDAVIGVFTVFLTLVASISLVVGGIGVMNIMLVSVTERTKEIGIRKSLGASTHSIVFQFLIESAVLTAIGGMIGIILGYAGGLLIGQLVYILLNMTLIPTINIQTVLIIVTISAFIGILFGVYPAKKASKLDPVESLRFE